jgi:DNA-binding transcriptional LysR family regulator
MRLSLEALETLDAIAEQGSFARAAEVLHRVPSALTYTIKKLETDLGVTLFDRSGKQARLTLAGERLLEEGRQLLRQAELVEQRARTFAAGWEAQLTIVVDEVIPLETLFPVIAEFDATERSTQIRLLTAMCNGSWNALLERRADLAVGAAGEAPQGSNLVCHAIGSARFVFVVAPQHPLATMAEPIPVAELAPFRAVVVAGTARGIDAPEAGTVPGQGVLTVPTMSAKISALTAALGVGYVPRNQAAPCLADGRLVAKRIDRARQYGANQIAWRAGEDGPALTWFRERLLARDMRARLLADIA